MGSSIIYATFEYTPNTIELSVSGNGYVKCEQRQNGTSNNNSTLGKIRNNTSSFSVIEGFSLFFSMYPDEGSLISKVKENGTDITSQITNPIDSRNIARNAKLEIIFEEVPPITYTLTIKSEGNGIASFEGTTIREKSNTFNVNEGSSAIVSFTPDTGYRIKSVKVNNTDVTANVSNNQYTISNINADASLEVEFEAITHILSITATGNGSATYNSTAVRAKMQTFIVNEGTSAVVTFTPDAGYRIKSVKINNTDVTSKVSNNQYTISNITADASLEVEFEAIPPTTYSFTIKATGNGTVTYDGTAIRDKSSSFTINEGTSAFVTFSPDAGHKIKSVKLNSTDVTTNVSNNQYMISSISANTSLEVEFEAITHTLSITAAGNGVATYNETSVRGKTSMFTVNEGTSAVVSFTPDAGYRIKSVKLNNVDVTS